jgi:hypothetical protein
MSPYIRRQAEKAAEAEMRSLRNRIEESNEPRLTASQQLKLPLRPPCYEPQAHDRFVLDETKSMKKTNDPLLKVIIRTVKKLAVEDIGVAAAKIQVYTTTGPNLWPPNRANSTYPIKFYAFKPFYKREFLTVPVTLHHVDNGVGPRAECIAVGESKAWYPLKDWLMTLPNRTILFKDSGSRVRAQRAWWNVNGKHFPLMKLPKELRLMIFEHALGGRRITPNVTSSPVEWTDSRVGMGPEDNYW